MSKKSKVDPGRRAPRPRKQNRPAWLLIGGLAVVSIAILALVWFALTPNRGNGGPPQFQVNTERLELGRQIFNQTVRASFTVTNAGSGPLTLSVPRVATVLEGC